MASRPKIRQRAKGELANEIAKAIHIRAYRPGEWLRQIDLEEAFQATRFDVRTALDELAVRKTIEHVPNRGYRVVEIDLATYRAIRDTRIILESAASRLVIGRVDEQAVARLDALAHEFSQAVQSGTRVQQSEINRAFHSLIYAHCGNPVLVETIWSLRDRSRGSAVTVWASHQALLASDADHHAMVAAIRAGDGERLAELISQHILKDLIEAGGAA
ncbi:GntR family transcriptional regulator [Bosea sp. (in: a-proteobacteria)]|jgi:DNA-binding GntR family transcriptional regulator|uniref:GntR family transcriptional regulator n=1 Tax=Bosea sp. (in: a-proteobacteria) TaxID=1871050 RepID=UPI002DDCE5B4|nr:GntR family transcriptional regulator [Bosea sp. (in: a-proteobacteria)]HEV2508696.1 GntR family transcriptional regulator [Bosea sp. (in: a-proteobacteria)]